MNFKILELNPNNIIVGVQFNPDNPQLDAAKHPGFTGEETMILLTRGDQQNYTVYYHDKEPYTFSHGNYRSTVVPSSIDHLRKAVTNYLASCGINPKTIGQFSSNTLKYMYFPHDDPSGKHPTHLADTFVNAYTREELKETFQGLTFEYKETAPTGAIVEYYTFEPRDFTREETTTQPNAETLIKDYLTWY